jgi:Predicted membrane protein (DUF2127)
VVFEAAKGLLVLLLGLGLLRLVHKNLDSFAEQLIRFLHIAPGGRLSNLFVTAAGKTTNKHLWVLAGAAVVYAVVRFAEAFGLWIRPRMGGVVRAAFRKHVFALGGVFADAPPARDQVGGVHVERSHRGIHVGVARASGQDASAKNGVEGRQRVISEARWHIGPGRQDSIRQSRATPRSSRQSLYRCG